MLDYSYSMQGKIIMSAITAAAIARHFRQTMGCSLSAGASA